MAAHLNEWCGDHTKPAHPFLDTQQNEALREPVQPCGLRGRREDQILRYECREYDPTKKSKGGYRIRGYILRGRQKYGRQYMSGSMKLGYRLLKGNISINTTKRTVRSRSKRKT